VPRLAWVALGAFGVVIALAATTGLGAPAPLSGAVTGDGNAVFVLAAFMGGLIAGVASAALGWVRRAR
jgi:hypothetical protein